ncbi:putative repeat protein (TIGR01451 family), partial [Paenarthrobacter sp. TE4293]
MTKKSESMKHTRPQKLLAAVVATAIMSLGVGGALAPPSLATTPGSPGVAQPGTPVYAEDFSNQNATAGAISILNYTGGPAAANETYTADTPYTPAGGQCNGWILNSVTPLPTSDAGCTNNQPAGWGQIQQMSIALGLAQGQTAAQAANNQSLSEYTNKPTGTITPGVQFRTQANTIPAIAGHYYAVSGYFAQVNCQATHASETFSLLINGTRQVLSTGLDPCGGSNLAKVQVTKLQSAAYQIPAGTTPSLGLELRNEATSGAGNDVAFDMPQIVDVTPQVDKSFTPSLIGPGGTSTVTLTVTNTDDLKAKNDWFITDTLPAGVVVAGTPNIGGTCVQAAGTNPLVRTAVAGGNTISVTGGDMALGMTSCTITVDVTAAAEGTYINGPANIVTNLNPPANATLIVKAPRLELTKALDASRLMDSDQFTTQIRTGSATGHVVSNSANATTTGTGSTVTAGTGTTGEYVANAGATYYLTESGTNLSGYSKVITCVDANGLQPDLPNGAVVDAAYSLAPVAGADISCVLTNTAVPAPELEFTKSADSSDIQDPSVVGDQITYTFTSTNTGNVPLTGVTINDPLAGLSALIYSWPGTPGTLLPGETVTAMATYAITQADIDAGHVANLATTTGNPPTGPPVTPPPAGTDTPLTPAPAMEFSKSADASDIQDPSVVGDQITYTFTSTNTGNVSLTNVSINDPLAGLSALTYNWPGVAGTLLPGQTVTATATYAITQADINAGHVANTATTTGTPPIGPAVTPPPAGTDTPLTTAPAMEFSKSADASGIQDPSVVGDLIAYTFTSKNTGNVPLTNVSISDPLAGLSALTYSWPGTPGELLPGQTVTATATYAITQADITAGHVANSATTTGTPPVGPPVTPPPGTTDTPLTSAPAMEFSKSADASGIQDPSVVGDLIAYTFTSKNTGNVPLTNVSINDPLVGLSALVYTWPGTPGELLPGQTVTATATYTITQADIDAGHVANAATTTGTPPVGPPVTPPPGTTDTPLTTAPAMEFSKSADASDIQNPSVVGDKITYTFTSKNTGNVKLTGVVIDDPLAGLSPLVYTWPGTAGELLPGQSVTATATYAITQADIDAGHVANVATTTGTPPIGPAVTPPPGTTDTPLTTAPAMEFSKSADASDIQNPSVVGDKITYTFTSKNTGNVKLTGVVIDDPLAGLSPLVYTWPGTAGELLPGQSVTATATYAITQADIDAGHVANVATTTGTPPIGPAVTPPPAGTDTPLTPGPALEFTKSADASDIQDPSLVGDQITYTFTSKNTGNVKLTGVVINDPLAGLSALTYSWPGTPGELLPGQSVTATATYAITQADIDAGHVANAATTTGTPPTGPPVTPPPGTTDTPLTPAPAMEFTKSADASAIQDPSVVGDEITYTFTSKNTGNVKLTGVVINDPLPGLSALEYTWPGTPGELLPGQTVTATATYAITQADINAGHVANTATTTGTPPVGPPVTPPPAGTDTPLTPAPAMEFSKSADASGVQDPSVVGDRIVYSFTAKNAGNVPLTNVSITDPLAGLSALTYTWPDAAGTLLPGQTVTATATYAITQADINAGHVANTATTTGTPPVGPPVTPPPAGTDTPLTPAPAMEFTKSADASAIQDPSVVGDEITYTFTSKNTGNVKLTGVVINDPLPGLSALEYSWPGTPGELLPGQTVTATATYAITQADIDAGHVANAATTTGTPPTGPPVTPPPGTTDTPLTPAPAMEFTKSSDASAIQKPAVVGDLITYSFTAKNSGNVTLKNVTIDDPLAGLSALAYTWPGTPGELQPGQTVTATATYAITQADINAGHVVNAATTSGTPPVGPPVTPPPGTTDTPLTPAPAMQFTKTADASAVQDPSVAGDEITYTFTAKNTGNVNLTNVSISDPLAGLSALEYVWPGTPGELLPGQTVTATATYAITQADIDAGHVANAATTTGTPPTGPPVTPPPGTTDTPLTPKPAMEFSKSADDSAIQDPSKVGDVITYAFSAKNTGNVTLKNVTITDPLAGLSALTYSWPGTPGELLPGQTMTATATYAITQADIDAGHVANAATTTGTPPTGPPVTPPPGTTDTPLTPAPAMEFTKSADASAVQDPSKVGDVITYTFTSKNAGNVTLTNVSIADPLAGLSALTYTWPGTPGELLPGQTVTATATYAITQADIDAGHVANAATTTGTPPTGPPVTPPPGTTDTPLTPAPAMEFTKSADASAVQDPSKVGDVITYTFTSKNAGNVTLTNVSIADPLAGLSA